VQLCYYLPSSSSDLNLNIFFLFQGHFLHDKFIVIFASWHHSFNLSVGCKIIFIHFCLISNEKNHWDRQKYHIFKFQWYFEVHLRSIYFYIVRMIEWISCCTACRVLHDQYNDDYNINPIYHYNTPIDIRHKCQNAQPLQ